MTAPQRSQISWPFRLFALILAGVTIMAVLLAAGCATSSSAPGASDPAASAPTIGAATGATAATSANLDSSGESVNPNAATRPDAPSAASETVPAPLVEQPQTAIVEAAVVNKEPDAVMNKEADPSGKKGKELESEPSSVEKLAAVIEANQPADAAAAPVAPAPERKIAEGPLAAEPAGIEAWINSDPLTLAQLRGRVVLVDFWTYTCINCIRTFPYLKLWNSRYADDGLVILGVHTPEFEFEKDYENVQQATKDNGIVWPVAQDNDFQTWRAYNNRFWPAKYLVDRDGVIRYTHFGEGAYAETERQIRELLKEAGADLSDDLEPPEDQQFDPAFLGSLDAEVTPELYAGYQRNFNTVMSGIRPYIIQTAYYQNPDTVVNFDAPEDLEPHHIYFNGTWLVESERTKHARVSDDYSDYIGLRYSAKSVNAVLTSDTGEAYRVRVTLDGEYLTEANKGADIHIGEDGESYLLVNEPRLYEIIDSPFYTQRQELRLSSNSPDFGLFAFTFGIYSEGP